MKKVIFTLLLIVVAVSTTYSQTDKKEFSPSGKTFAKVFFNYNFDMTEDVEGASAFQLQRSYLGYKYSFSENFSTKITLDVGNNDEGSAYTAFLKTAQLDWKVFSPLKMSLGLIGMKQWNDQEKFWGYRYVEKSFQDKHKFGTSADLGVNFEYSPIKMLKVNFLVVNGEGYKSIQDESGGHRIGGNLVLKPIDGLTLKGYFDFMPNEYAVDTAGTVENDGSTISNMSFFAGYKVKDMFRIGAEYNKMSNGKKYTGPAEDHELNGISVYGTYIINKKFEVFGRFDQLSSNTLDGADEDWNYDKDGSMMIFGVQCKPVKGISTALNYRIQSFEGSDDPLSWLYLNFQIKL